MKTPPEALASLERDMAPAREVISRVTAAYVALSVLVAASMVWLIARTGSAGFYAWQGTADPSAVAWRFVNFVTAWVALGVALMLARHPRFVRQHLPLLIACTLIFFEYLIPLREPNVVREGDFSAYFDAAVAMGAGLPINQNVPRLYLYPPLLATILQPLTGFGLMPVLGLFKIGSQLMLGVVVIVLERVMRRAQYAPVVAAALLITVVMANAPLQHNFVFSQVNVYVLCAMLLCLWLYPRSPVWSAIALAVGAHLKVYPLLLAFPFVIVRDRRWLVAFAAALAAIALGTSLLNGPQYYGEFFHAIRGLTETGLRSSAVDSLVYNSFRLAGVSQPVAERLIATLGRLALGAWGLWVSVRFMRATPQMPGNASAVVLRGFAILPVVMLLVSPSQWPHHFVLVIPSVLLLLPFIRAGGDLTTFGVAYGMIFLIPVNEIFPFPYLRLVSLCAILWLVQRSVRAGRGMQPWFVDLQGKWAFGPVGAAAEARY